MKKLFLCLINFIFLINIVYAADLSDFPKMFIEDRNLNALIVAGDNAPSSDAIAQANLAVFFTNYLGKPTMGYSKLVSEVDDLEQNLILIGNPCDNNISLEILDVESCDEDLEPGKAIIRLIEKDEHFYLLIMSRSNNGAREAVDVLTNFYKYDLEGDEFVLDVEEDVVQEETDAEKERQRIIEEMNKKISEQKEESKDIEEQEEVEQVETKQEEPEPVPEEEGLIKKIVSWFRSLFGR